jgi:hypothetical protein
MKTEHPRRNLFKGLFLLVTFLMTAFSCTMNPSLEEVSPQTLKDETFTSTTLRGSTALFALPANVSLNKVELYLDKGIAATGTVTVEIRDITGGTTIASTTVTAASLTSGASWKTFNFAPAALLVRGNAYRIYLKRSDPHNYSTNNYLFWRTSALQNK